MMLAEAAAAAILVSVDIHGDAPEVVRIEAWPLRSEGEARAAVTVSLPRGTPDALLELDGRLAWRLEASAENHWTLPLDIAADQPGEQSSGPKSVRLTLWPAAKITAQLRLPPGE